MGEINLVIHLIKFEKRSESLDQLWSEGNLSDWYINITNGCIFNGTIDFMRYIPHATILYIYGSEMKNAFIY